MALFVRFTGVKAMHPTHETLYLPWEIPGVGARIHSFTFRPVQMSPTYSDSVAILTPEETQEWVWSFYGSSPESLPRIEQLLKDVDYVIAHLYEWDSGMS